MRVMPAARFVAVLANFRAEGSNRDGVLAVARHHRGGQAAECGAVHGERDAFGHRGHIFFPQAPGRAAIAGIGAAIT